MTPEEQAQARARQKARAVVTGLALGFLAILFFAITLAKIGASHSI